MMIYLPRAPAQLVSASITKIMRDSLTHLNLGVGAVNNIGLSSSRRLQKFYVAALCSQFKAASCEFNSCVNELNACKCMQASLRTSKVTGFQENNFNFRIFHRKYLRFIRLGPAYHLLSLLNFFGSCCTFGPP